MSGLPGLAALIALVIATLSLQATHTQLQITEQGQITDRYNAAVTNLGSASTDIRLGGIYALQRLMQDSPRDQSTVIAVLCAFIRDHAPATAKLVHAPASPADLRTDIQAALTVVTIRNTANDGSTTFIDLNNTQLTGAHLDGAHLDGAHLTGADLHDANLDGAHLAGADLHDANLDGAYLDGAHLDGANLADANLADANLNDANLTRAYLVAANLTRAYLIDANVYLADFRFANLTDAALDGANVKDAAEISIPSSGPPRGLLTGGAGQSRRLPRWREP